MIFICIQTFVIINLIEYWDLQSRLLLVLMEISFSISLPESPYKLLYYNIIKDSENYGLTPSQLNMSDLSEPLGTYDLNDINAIEDIILEYSYQYTAPIYTSLWKRPDLNYNSLFNNQSKYDDKSFWDSTENTFVQWEDITDATPNYTAEVLPDASFEWIYNYLQGNVCDGGNASVEIGMPCGEIGNDSLECGGPGGNCISYADPAHVNLFGPQSFADYMPEYVYFIYYGKSG